MKLIKTTICIAALGILASCGVKINDSCAGWKPVRVSDATAQYMAQNDARAIKELIAHQEFGAAQGCW